MQEYLEREYLMFNFSFYRFVFHTIKPPKTCPVRKKQFNILVPLHRKSNIIQTVAILKQNRYCKVKDSIGLQNWAPLDCKNCAPLDCKTGLHWLAKLGGSIGLQNWDSIAPKSTPFSCAKISAPFYVCSDCQFNCLCSLSICNKMKAHKII